MGHPLFLFLFFKRFFDDNFYAADGSGNCFPNGPTRFTTYFLSSVKSPIAAAEAAFSADPPISLAASIGRLPGVTILFPCFYEKQTTSDSQNAHQ